MIVERMRSEIHPGREIRKPRNKYKFIFDRWERLRGEDVFVCCIHHPERIVEQRITASQFEHAFQQLVDAGFLERQWYVRNMPECSDAKAYYSPHTTIGAVFELLGVAIREQGGYRRLP